MKTNTSDPNISFVNSFMNILEGKVSKPINLKIFPFCKYFLASFLVINGLKLLHMV